MSTYQMHPKLHGKSLPTYFANGYIRACMASEGRSLVMTWCVAAAEEIVPRRSDINEWIAPLNRYFVYSAEPLQPLDYFFVSLFQRGMARIFAAKAEQLVPAITRNIGAIWWRGEVPVSTYQDTYSLQRILAPMIMERLNVGKIDAIKVTKSSMISKERLALIGIKTFIDMLQKRSNVSMQFYATKGHIGIGIPECPFCLGQSNECHVFLGVFEAFLEWLQGSSSLHQILPVLEVNRSMSTGHSIVFDYLLPHERPSPMKVKEGTPQTIEALQHKVQQLEQERDQARRQWLYWEQKAHVLQRELQKRQAEVAELTKQSSADAPQVQQDAEREDTITF
jgi:hypothetical protein